MAKFSCTNSTDKDMAFVDSHNPVGKHFYAKAHAITDFEVDEAHEAAVRKQLDVAVIRFAPSFTYKEVDDPKP